MLGTCPHFFAALVTALVSTNAAAPQDSSAAWRDLRVGVKSPAAKSLQAALKTLGYEPGMLDGVYNLKLAAVLCSFASVNALTCDAKVVPEPLAGGIADGLAVAHVDADLHAAIAGGTLWSSVAKADARTVAALQSMLVDLGYLPSGAFTAGTSDVATTKAVTAFFARQGETDTARGVGELLEAHEVLEARRILATAAKSANPTAFLATVDAPLLFAIAYKDALPPGDPSPAWIADGLRIADFRLQAFSAAPATAEEQQALIEALVNLGYMHAGDTDLVAAANRFAQLHGLRPNAHGVSIEVTDAITRELTRAETDARIARKLAQPSLNEASVFTEAMSYPSFQVELKKLLRNAGVYRDSVPPQAEVDAARRAWPNTTLDDSTLVGLNAFADAHGIAHGDGVIAGDRRALLAEILRTRTQMVLARRVANARSAGILNADLAKHGDYLKEVVSAASSLSAAPTDTTSDVPSALAPLYAPGALTHLTLGATETDAHGPLHALESVLHDLGFPVSRDGTYDARTRDAVTAIARDAAMRATDGRSFSPELLRPLTMRYARMLDSRRDIGADITELTTTLARRSPNVLVAMLDAITAMFNATAEKRSAAAEPLLAGIDKQLAAQDAEKRASWLKIRNMFATQSDDIAGIGVLVSSMVGLMSDAIVVLPPGSQRDALQTKIDVLVERNAEMLLATAGAPKSLDAHILARLAPNLDAAHAEAYASALQAAMDQFAIATLHARAMFIAQVGHETMNFRYLAELGSPSYFTHYDGRRDLGNTAPGDGYRYRGRGFIQITGRANYAKAGQELFPEDPHYLLDDPDAASQADVAARLAGWFWQTHELNSIADKKPSSVAFREVTERINGGKVGYSDRVRLYTLVLPLL